MGAKSKIEWTEASWTPIRARNLKAGKVGWHCAHKSDGCRNCYAETMNRRLGTGLDYKPANEREIELFLDEKMLTAPLRWRRQRRIFVCSMTDLFADFVKDDWIDKVFAVMALCPQHTFQVLTKRPERMRDYLNAVASDYDDYALFQWADAGGRLCQDGDGGFTQIMNAGWPLHNVWLGVSTEDQKTADERIPLLLDTPAAKYFVSYEPALGPIDFTNTRLAESEGDLNALTGDWGRSLRSIGGPRLDWVIAGGESGPGARPPHPFWFRSVRDQCAAAGVPFFFKQWGAWTPGENVDRQSGVVDTAKLFGGRWTMGRENLSRSDGHVDDQPDVYRVGKKAAGALLDGREHREQPA